MIFEFEDDMEKSKWDGDQSDVDWICDQIERLEAEQFYRRQADRILKAK